MNVGCNILLRMFGRPRGLLGRLGGMVMARTNRRYAAWVVHLLDVQPGDRVLDIGFGPGVAVQLLSATARQVAGIDPSTEMLKQALRRNAEGIRAGRVALRQGTADRLPFTDGSFDAVLTLNSMQVWPNPLAGLSEIHRVLQSGGRLALAFTDYSGQPREGVPELLVVAGFTGCRIAETERAFCVLARKA
jgi:ubiquinone/menaquinone biosynthesis C-methylase UbiE